MIFIILINWEIVRKLGPQCNVYKGFVHRCSGIIISRYVFIAPVKCVQDWKSNGLEVRIQTSQKSLELHQIIDVEIHNSYASRLGRPINDIAVVRVAGSLGRPLNYIESFGKGRAAQNGTSGTLVRFNYDGLNAHIWGRQDYRATVESRDSCYDFIMGELEAGQLCVIVAQPNQTWPSTGYRAELCPGDEGSSFVVNNRIVAMASYWIPDERGKCSERAVYTNIAVYNDFIKQSLHRFDEKAKRGAIRNPKGTGNYVVSVENKGTKFICAGALISDREIITSADCARRNLPNKWSLTMIRAGTEVPTKGGQLRKEIRRCYCDVHHKGFNSRRRNYDIAVMRVDQPFDLSGDVSAIDLYGKGDEVYFVDSGIFSYFPNGLSLVNEMVQVERTDTCNEKYSSSPYGTIADDHMCTQPSKSCANDYGGILLIRNRWRNLLAGVATFGVNSCDPQRNLDVLTEIAKVRSKIDGCLDWFKKLENEGTIDQYGDYRSWFEKLFSG